MITLSNETKFKLFAGTTIACMGLLDLGLLCVLRWMNHESKLDEIASDKINENADRIKFVQNVALASHTVNSDRANDLEKRVSELENEIESLKESKENSDK